MSYNFRLWYLRCIGLFWVFLNLFWREGRNLAGSSPDILACLSQQPALCWLLGLFVRRIHCTLTKCHSACATIWDWFERWEQRTAEIPFVFASEELSSFTMRHCLSFLTCFRVTNRSLEGLLVGSKLHKLRSEGPWPRSYSSGWWIELWLSRSTAYFSPKIKRQETRVLQALWTNIGKTWDTHLPGGCAWESIVH